LEAGLSDPLIKRGQVICRTGQLEPGGLAFRFMVFYEELCLLVKIPISVEDHLAAFVVNYQGNYYAYLNRCAHLPMQMDWNAGELFDDAKRYLVCATHYAVYEPDTGVSIAGPCRLGSQLVALPIRVIGEDIILL
jgi:nitrite reductase/ring-hydroxylating ferredoxin subunit